MDRLLKITCICLLLTITSSTGYGPISTTSNSPPLFMFTSPRPTTAATMLSNESFHQPYEVKFESSTPPVPVPVEATPSKATPVQQRNTPTTTTATTTKLPVERERVEVEKPQSSTPQPQPQPTTTPSPLITSPPEEVTEVLSTGSAVETASDCRKLSWMMFGGGFAAAYGLLGFFYLTVWFCRWNHERHYHFL